MAKKHLIIGSGKAALSALEAIRRITPEDEIKLVSMEACLPYSPATLAYVLSGTITEADLWMRDENYFRNLRSTLVQGREVAGILTEKKKVTYRDGGSEHYDTLLIASGAGPLRPRIDGLGETICHDFRTLTDCRRLLQELETKQDVAILGAGMVGMGVAAALSQRGCRVSVIEKQRTILSMYFDEEAEKYIRNIFEEQKIRLLVDKEVIAVTRIRDKILIASSDRSSIDVDILINATGFKSRMSFLEGTGVRTHDGILVDSRMHTGVDCVYAAGDVAEAQDFFTGIPKMNAIVASAVRQGRVAGTNMAGGDAEYEGAIPMTAFNFLGNKAFSLGLLAPQDNAGHVLKQNDDKKRRFKKFVFHGDRLVGAMFLNEKVDPGIISYLIKERIDLAPHKEALFEGTKPLSDPWLRSLKFSPSPTEYLGDKQ
jgi:phenylglyoxylate dehydrogenase epsilon subunit